jgi:hypothetical protein
VVEVKSVKYACCRCNDKDECFAEKTDYVVKTDNNNCCIFTSKKKAEEFVAIN